MVCGTLVVTSGATGLKAVQFGKFWRDNITDDNVLKTIAVVGILKMGDTLTDEPVDRSDPDYAYVVFKPTTLKYTELNIVAGLTKIAAGLFAWVKANPGKAVILLGMLAYISIRIVDWASKNAEKEIAISEDTTVKAIIDDNTLTPEQKIAAILAYLQSKAGGETNWGLVILGAAALLGAAYVLARRD